MFSLSRSMHQSMKTVNGNHLAELPKIVTLPLSFSATGQKLQQIPAINIKEQSLFHRVMSIEFHKCLHCKFGSSGLNRKKLKLLQITFQRVK